MRASQYLFSTIKEDTASTDIISYKLMLRAGIIRKLASGLYTWLPTGLRILHKLESIIRKEMDKIGALEISMPIIQPANLWRISGRLIEYGPELLKFNDRNRRLLVLSPTNEEVITNIIRNELHSYKQLPLNFYQIKTKFRDEPRARFGVIRSKEFIMKDAYSFHIDQKSLQTTFDIMYQTYKSIFNFINLDFNVVEANTGSIGGHISYEFHAPSNNGEDSIVFSTKSNYAVNIELAKTIIPKFHFPAKPTEIMRLMEVPNIYSIKQLLKKFNLPLKKTIKIFIVHAVDKINHSLIALILRGDHELNHLKVAKLPQVSIPLVFASKEEVKFITGVELNLLGPINLSLPLIIDYNVSLMSDFIACANTKNKYFFGINWNRDLPLPEIADLRKVVDGDLSPDGNGILQVKRGIEIGHIFQLNNKYSNIFKAVINNKGNIQSLKMGCYGIGITRSIAATIEQNHDKYGILWPDSLAPFNVVIIPINMYKSLHIEQIAEELYQKFNTLGIDVLLDDRVEHPGVIFHDMDLIGIPHNIIISKFHLKKNNVEYKHRRDNKKKIIKLNEIVDFIMKKISD